MPRSVFACLECLERCRKPFYNLEEACFTLFKSAKCLKESLFSIEGFFQGISERREPFCELSSVLHIIQFFLWIKQCEFYRNINTLFYIVLYMHQTLLYVILNTLYIRRFSAITGLKCQDFYPYRTVFCTYPIQIMFESLQTNSKLVRIFVINSHLIKVDPFSKELSLALKNNCLLVLYFANSSWNS